MLEGTLYELSHSGGLTESRSDLIEISDEERNFADLYLTLMSENAPQRRYENARNVQLSTLGCRRGTRNA